MNWRGGNLVEADRAPWCGRRDGGERGRGVCERGDWARAGALSGWVNGPEEGEELFGRGRWRGARGGLKGRGPCSAGVGQGRVRDELPEAEDLAQGIVALSKRGQEVVVAVRSAGVGRWARSSRLPLERGSAVVGDAVRAVGGRVGTGSRELGAGGRGGGGLSRRGVHAGEPGVRDSKGERERCVGLLEYPDSSGRGGIALIVECHERAGGLGHPADARGERVGR